MFGEVSDEIHHSTDMLGSNMLVCTDYTRVDLAFDGEDLDVLDPCWNVNPDADCGRVTFVVPAWTPVAGDDEYEDELLL